MAINSQYFSLLCLQKHSDWKSSTIPYCLTLQQKYCIVRLVPHLCVSLVRRQRENKHGMGIIFPTIWWHIVKILQFLILILSLSHSFSFVTYPSLFYHHHPSSLVSRGWENCRIYREEVGRGGGRDYFPFHFLSHRDVYVKYHMITQIFIVSLDSSIIIRFYFL